MDEQSQQENLEEKLKDYVDCLTDKRYLWLLASFYTWGPVQLMTNGTKGVSPTRTLFHLPVPRPGKELWRACAWPWPPVYFRTFCWSAASLWRMPWKSALRKVKSWALGEP